MFREENEISGFLFQAAGIRILVKIVINGQRGMAQKPILQRFIAVLLRFGVRENGRHCHEVQEQADNERRDRNDSDNNEGGSDSGVHGGYWFKDIKGWADRT